jgi:hypothetical protein
MSAMSRLTCRTILAPKYEQPALLLLVITT